MRREEFSSETAVQTAAPTHTQPPKIYISDLLLSRTGSLLASFAVHSHREGVVYWFGVELGSISVVTTLVVPNATMSAGCVSTTEEANAEALSIIVGTPLVLIGQAHSHPGRNI